MIAVAFQWTINLFYRLILIDESSDIYQILWKISLIGQPVTIYGAIYCVIWRCWMVYFDTNFAKEAASKLWKARINSCISHEENWYESHKDTYGNHKHVFKYISCLYITSATLASIVWFMEPYITYFVAASLDFTILKGIYRELGFLRNFLRPGLLRPLLVEIRPWWSGRQKT